MLKRNSLIALFFGALALTACQTTSVNLGDSMDKGDDAMTDDGSAMMDDDSMTELPDVIKIGFVGPLTGNAAAYGQDVKAGVEFYFSQHPTIGGKQVEVIYEDGKCNGQDASNAAQKLITVDKVQVIFGGQCSGETLAAAPIAEQNKVILFSSASSSPEVSTAGDYVFRNYPSDAKVAQTLVEEASKGHHRLALLSEQTDYAQGYRGVVQKLVADKPDFDLVVDEAYGVDNTDFRTLLTKAKDANADVLINIAQSAVTNGFSTKQARELGLDLQIYGTDTINGPDFFSTAQDAAEGVIQVAVVEDPSRDGYDELVSQLPESQAGPVFQALAYDGAAVVAKAIEEVGYDGTAIKDYLNSMGTYHGVGSDITFDENGDNDVAAGVKVARDGKFVFLNE